VKKPALIGAVAGVAAAILGVGWAYWNGWSIPLLGWGEAERKLTLYGNVERRQVDLGFDVPGRVLAMLFEEGDAVRKGVVMARLEADRFESRVKVARGRVSRQQAVVDELEAGTRQEEIEEARARVASAEATLRNRILIYERTEFLAEDDFASRQALDDARAARDSASARLRMAEAALELALAGPREEEIRAARAQLDTLQARLVLALEDLEDTEVQAPSDGTVLSRVVEPGAIVASGEPLYIMTVDDPVWVRAYVPEPDLGKIRPGTPAKVFTDSRPDRPYRGQVGFISPSAEFTPKSVYTPDVRTSLIYRIRVVVPEPNEGLRQGMPVTVVVPLENGPVESAEQGEDG